MSGRNLVHFFRFSCFRVVGCIFLVAKDRVCCFRLYRSFFIDGIMHYPVFSRASIY